MELARAMLIEKSLPPSLWAEAVSHAAYIRNRCPTKALEGKTPLEAWTGRKPDVSHFREFGCDVWVMNETNISKLSPKSVKMKFVGFETGSKAIRYYDQARRSVRISRNFAFNENDELTSLEDKTDVPGLKIEGENAGKQGQGADQLIQKKDSLNRASESSSLPSEEPIRSRQTDQTDQNDNGTRTLRQRKEKIDYRVLHNTGRTGKVPDTSRPIITSSTSQEEAEEAAGNIAIAMLSKQRTLEAGLPNTLEEAKASNEWPKWDQAIQDEMEQLERLGTWEKSDLPKERSAIGCRWVFTQFCGIKMGVFEVRVLNICNAVLPAPTIIVEFNTVSFGLPLPSIFSTCLRAIIPPGPLSLISLNVIICLQSV